MKKIIPFVLLMVLLSACSNKNSQHRIELNFDDNWLFYKGDILNAHSVIFNDNSFEQTNLPHDWAIDGPIRKDNPSREPGGFFPGGIGWYRKHFHLQPEWAGKRIFVRFDGIYRNSDVWVNGQHVGHRFYGYVSHYYDITPYVQFSTPNIIAVRVDVSQQPADRWYSGAGIYRHVWLTVLDPVHIPIWGTYVTTPHVETTDAAVQLETDVINDGLEMVSCELATRIINPDGKEIAKGETLFKVPAGDILSVRQNFKVYVPKLWSPDTPDLYRAVSRLKVEGRTTDDYETPFGIRKVRFDPEKGFLLNDQKVVLKGVNLHHDGGNLGAAVPEQVWERRFEILKEMGVNAIRFAHNPHAPELLDLCDRMGFLVYNEMYDKWAELPFNQTRTPENDFYNTWKQDLTDFINRDRNHPSVVIWSVGNEVGEQLHDPATAVRIYNSLAYHVHQQEPSRLVTCALHPGDADKGHEVPSRLMHQTDVVSYNYRTHQFAEWHQEFPTLSWIASETKAYQRETPGDWTKIDFSKNSWFFVKDFVAGQFIWAGIDYLGESRGWPDKGVRCGLIYTNGVRKPYSWFTESIYSEKPMVHITVLDDSLTRELNSVETWQESWYGPPLTDHWTFPEKQGDIALIFVFSTCEQVELDLNGNSLGRKNRSDFPDGVLRWEVPYQRGRLEARGFIKGKRVAEHVLNSAGPPVQLQLLPDVTKRKANGRDVFQVLAEVVDADRILVPRARSMVTFEIAGPARIIAVDNGDMSDHSNPKGDRIECRGGQCLVILQSTGQKGRVELTASSGNLKSAQVNLTFD